MKTLRVGIAGFLAVAAMEPSLLAQEAQTELDAPAAAAPAYRLHIEKGNSGSQVGGTGQGGRYRIVGDVGTIVGEVGRKYNFEPRVSPYSNDLREPKIPVRSFESVKLLPFRYPTEENRDGHRIMFGTSTEVFFASVSAKFYANSRDEKAVVVSVGNSSSASSLWCTLYDGRYRRTIKKGFEVAAGATVQVRYDNPRIERPEHLISMTFDGPPEEGEAQVRCRPNNGTYAVNTEFGILANDYFEPSTSVRFITPARNVNFADLPASTVQDDVSPKTVAANSIIAQSSAPFGGSVAAR